MENPRKYGEQPFKVALIHGGPGGMGEMSSVARKLHRDLEIGVLEPIQTKSNIDDLVKELRDIIMQHGTTPLTLIGYSWGAWLSYFLTAEHPELVEKLVLVSSGPFEEKYVGQLSRTRSDRLSTPEKNEYNNILKLLNNDLESVTDQMYKRLGEFTQKTDLKDPIEDNADEIKIEHITGLNMKDTIHVLYESLKLRESGKLYELGKKINCPVIAIHGDYDPHPADGVKDPLSKVLSNFRFILLQNCGHTPWREKNASEDFYNHLYAILN
ncbi:MAG: alpha/beta fold hydrolase [Candidatus Lokiarchaeota archaeon]|nr:alpha/beta fold hydrolase [Candidatus Lokiarchaeota archaeon]